MYSNHIKSATALRSFALKLFLMMFVSLSASAGPSFDCSKAATKVEQLICMPENSDLQEADQKLAAGYDSLRTAISFEQSRWLTESQKNWLEYRESCIHNHGYSNCLLQHYRDRIDALALGVIENPIRREQLPYSIILPGGLKGEFVLEQISGEEINEDGTSAQVQNTLLFRSASGDQPVWHSESNPDALMDVTIIHLSPGKVALHIEEEISTQDKIHGKITGWTRHYFVLSKDNKFFVQGDKETIRYPAWGPDTGHLITTRWVAGSDIPLLQVDERHIDEHNISPYLQARNLQRFYRFRFDGQPWDEQLPAPQQRLDAPDGAMRYHALYRDIVATHKPTAGTEKSCVEEGVDWTLATQGLNQWMHILTEAHKRGVAYSQAPAIVSTILASGERPKITDAQREMFAGLDFYRRKLEETYGWQEMFEEFRSLPTNDDSYIESWDFMNQKGFPNITNHCLSSTSLDDYEINPEPWFYSFWLRRHLDGTYDVAKLAIDYGLGPLKKQVIPVPQQTQPPTQETPESSWFKRLFDILIVDVVAMPFLLTVLLAFVLPWPKNGMKRTIVVILVAWMFTAAYTFYFHTPATLTKELDLPNSSVFVGLPGILLLCAALLIPVLLAGVFPLARYLVNRRR